MYKSAVRATTIRRKVTIAFAGDEISRSTPMWCQCSCQYFCFFCEVALTKHGSSKVKFSNGASPVYTNPRLRPCACKHILYLAAIIVAHPPIISASTRLTQASVPAPQPAPPPQGSLLARLLLNEPQAE